MNLRPASDTFVRAYHIAEFGVDEGNGGAIVRDYHPGEDHVTVDGDAPGTLTDVGDIWTVSSPGPTYRDFTGDPNAIFQVSFEIDGIRA